MSNRGRQNVASFLTKNLGLDWRMGAEWFESKLIDYDPASNYGNWNYTAGIGNDARSFRWFNTLSKHQTTTETAIMCGTGCPSLQMCPATTFTLHGRCIQLNNRDPGAPSVQITPHRSLICSNRPIITRGSINKPERKSVRLRNDPPSLINVGFPIGNLGSHVTFPSQIQPVPRK